MSTVSVLLPVYNGDKYISKSIKSVLDQTYADFELLILNDGSTDNSLEIARQFSLEDARIRVISFEKNIGLINVLNEGMRQATGSFVARIDSDDEWVDRNKIKKQVFFLENHVEYALVGTKAIVVNEDDKIIGGIDCVEDDKNIRKQILIKNSFFHPTILIRKDAAEKCGCYQLDEKFVEDYGLWLRIGRFYKFKNLPFFGVKYRLNPKGETLTNNRQQVINSFKLSFKYRHFYPNFSIACIKWILRYLKTFL